jgi:hypothetical protein
MTLSLLGSANLVRPGLRPNGPSNTASRHRRGDRSDKILHPSQVAGDDHPPFCRHGNDEGDASLTCNVLSASATGPDFCHSVLRREER